MQRFGCRKCGTPLPAVQAGEALRIRCAQRACGHINVIPADPNLAPWEAHGSTKLLVVDDPEGAVLLAPPIARVRSHKLLISLCIVLALLGTLALPDVRRTLVFHWATYELRTTNNASMAQHCCQLLKELGPSARAAAPLVWDLHFRKFSDGKALTEDSINSTLDAIDALFIASRRPIVTADKPETELIKALQFPDPQVRRKAAGLLGDGRAVSGSAVDALATMAERSRDATRIDAINALGKIGPDAAPAAPKLIKLLNASGTIREATVRALIKIAPGDPHVLAAIDTAGIPAPMTQPSRR